MTVQSGRAWNARMRRASESAAAQFVPGEVYHPHHDDGASDVNQLLTDLMAGPDETAPVWPPEDRWDAWRRRRHGTA